MKIDLYLKNYYKNVMEFMNEPLSVLVFFFSLTSMKLSAFVTSLFWIKILIGGVVFCVSLVYIKQLPMVLVNNIGFQFYLWLGYFVRDLFHTNVLWVFTFSYWISALYFLWLPKSFWLTLGPYTLACPDPNYLLLFFLFITTHRHFDQKVVCPEMVKLLTAPSQPSPSRLTWAECYESIVRFFPSQGPFRNRLPSRMTMYPLTGLHHYIQKRYMGKGEGPGKEFLTHVVAPITATIATSVAAYQAIQQTDIQRRQLEVSERTTSPEYIREQTELAREQTRQIEASTRLLEAQTSAKLAGVEPSSRPAEAPTQREDLSGDSDSSSSEGCTLSSPYEDLSSLGKLKMLICELFF